MTSSKLVPSSIPHFSLHFLILKLSLLLDFMFKYRTVNQKSFLSLTVDFMVKFSRH